jgi:alkaline phosphatase D
MAHSIAPVVRRYGVSRRQFMHYAAAVSAVGSAGVPAGEPLSSGSAATAYPFALGVASGDPLPDGVVLWTKLSSDPISDESFAETHALVDWEIADDERMSRIVRRGQAVATRQLGHAVHVEVEGLEPDRIYHYRFRFTGQASPVGRTRTAPPASAMPQRLRFAFTSCQNYQDGFYNGYPHMVAEDPDLVIHLGDYIYEHPAKPGGPRQHLGGETRTLADYRRRYGQYRLDEDLAEAHRLMPWAVTWDDHEFDNNYANLVSEEDGVSPEAFLARRLAAYQAYYEFLPLRRVSLPRGPRMRLYRQLRYGRLASFHLLDTRQYRTDQPLGDGMHPLEGKVFDPQATMLGAEQEAWLFGSLLSSQSCWNVLAQQVMMAMLDRGSPGEPRYSMDQWAGYDVSRRRLLEFFAERPGLNPVVLTGDIHLNWVNDLRRHHRDPSSEIVATELVGTSMSSAGNGGRPIPVFEEAAARNECVRFYDCHRGYVSCTLTPLTWQADFRATPLVDRRGSEVETVGSFVIEAGRPGAHPA